MSAPHETTFGFKDLYPEFAGEETGERVIPDEDKQQTLAENADDTVKASKHAKPKFIFIALGLIVALVIFFGGDK